MSADQPRVGSQWSFYRRWRTDGRSMVNLGFAPATAIGCVLLASLTARIPSGVKGWIMVALVALSIAWVSRAMYMFAVGDSTTPPAQRPQRVSTVGLDSVLDDHVSAREDRRSGAGYAPGSAMAAIERAEDGANRPTMRAEYSSSRPQGLKEWREAERRVYEWLVRQGEDAQLGQGTRDGGIDVESSRLVVQVKHWKNRATGPSVQQIRGVAASKDKLGVVVALSGFTADAVTFANEAGVALFDYSSGYPEPVNARAKMLFRRP